LNFDKNELFGAALIGFDLIDGPFLKWKKEFNSSDNISNLDDFAMNFYLSFRGGNSGKKPRAILYDNFYIVAFPQDLELCCLFMKPKGIENNIKQLNKVASRIMVEMEDDGKEDEIENNGEDDVEEIKRLIVNLLNGTEMTTPELRKYFKLSNSQIWKVMSDLENNQKIKRTDKKGRAILWTASS
jgi:Mor family transcriptional regulator